MKASDLLDDLGRCVAYYPQLTLALGSVAEALLVSQFLFWDGKQRDEQGWIYKTQEQLRKETGLTKHEQRRARRDLVAKGVLREKRAGVPARLHFQIDKEKLVGLWESCRCAPGCIEQELQDGDSRRSCSSQTRDQDGRFTDIKASASSAPFIRSIEDTEITAERTAECVARPGEPFSRSSPRAFIAIEPKRSCRYVWGAVVPLEDPVHAAMRKAALVDAASTDKKT